MSTNLLPADLMNADQPTLQAIVDAVPVGTVLTPVSGAGIRYVLVSRKPAQTHTLIVEQVEWDNNSQAFPLVVYGNVDTVNGTPTTWVANYQSRITGIMTNGPTNKTILLGSDTDHRSDNSADFWWINEVTAGDPSPPVGDTVVACVKCGL